MTRYFGVTYLVLMIVGALLFGIAHAAPRDNVVAPHIVATSQVGAEVCYPAKAWDTGTANPEDRPCTTVMRPYEDGSGDLILGTVGGDAAVCTIPNVFEERGHFAIKCHRVPNR